MVRIALLLSILALLSIPAAFAHADEPDPIIEIDGARPNQEAFKDAKATEPLVIRSAADAARYFDEQAMAKLNEWFDWKQQVLLVFAWRGSGQDKLTYTVAESYPEQVIFKLKRGLTKDLRPHIHVYALRSNVTWKVDAERGR